MVVLNNNYLKIPVTELWLLKWYSMFNLKINAVNIIIFSTSLMPMNIGAFY